MASDKYDMTDRIKQKELKDVKAELIKRQKGRCPLCKASLSAIKPINVVVDHCHETGRIRAAMCRGCNGAEGKMLRLAKTWGKSKCLSSARDFLIALVKYWEHHGENPSEWIYPSHKTPLEEKELKRKRAKRAYAKAKAARTSK